MILEILFWLLLFLIIYTFFGYPLLLWILVGIKNSTYGKPNIVVSNYEPDVCLFVTAYNEKDFVAQKVKNSLQLDYPKEKIQYLWITDGSDDGTPELLKEHMQNEVHHLKERRGKMHAMNRGMNFVHAPIVVFSDTNTLLNKNAIRAIVACFSDPKTGCVAGEKRIFEKNAEVASAAGEGFYWKYESWVKKLDAQLNSAVGAVGELFAIRHELFEDVEPDTILDDFVISLRIAQRGYKIRYSPDAYAEETASANVKEELKRKIRIAAGGIQSLFKLRQLLNPFRYGVLSWQFFSHKVLRWTLAPIALFILPFLNGVIFFKEMAADSFTFYSWFFLLQIFGYLLVVVGWLLENIQLRMKFLFVPYYFIATNLAAILGMIRYFSGKQSVKWERSKRAVI